MWADPQVVAHISGTPSTPEQSWSRLLRYAGHWQHLGFGYWVVEAKVDGAFIGEVGFADYHRDTTPGITGLPEAGWALKTAVHGKGYATEAVSAMLDWADRKLDAEQTVCLLDPTYSASINVARKVDTPAMCSGPTDRSKRFSCIGCVGLADRLSTTSAMNE